MATLPVYTLSFFFCFVFFTKIQITTTQSRFHTLNQEDLTFCTPVETKWCSVDSLSCSPVCRSASPSSGGTASSGAGTRWPSGKCKRTTLGITPANYSLGTFWCGGPQSCPSQVKKLWLLLSHTFFFPLWIPLWFGKTVQWTAAVRSTCMAAVITNQ